ncbi:MAG TPA: GNAT family N-acetyltransferase [Deinococcales bacterium]|nr:GNAT family N-acetyltransferase [Deinococcales bacterium]
MTAIRPFSTDDYDAFTALHNAVRPEHPFTPTELREEDERLAADPRLRQGRILAGADGKLIGYVAYSQNPGMYHPQRFMLEGGVLPAFQGTGIGRGLYESLLETLAPYDPISFRATAREDSERGLRFLSERGFVETMRFWESVLDVQSFDPGPHTGREENLAREGIVISTVEELSRSDDRWREKLHELFSQIREDVPRSEPASPITLERFIELVIEDSMTLHDAWFVARHGERYVGLSDLYRTASSPDLFTGLTGVLREYRGRGIALALKLRGIEYARERGVGRIRTNNASTNRPMLAVNEKLGFEKEPVWLSLVREIRQAP